MTTRRYQIVEETQLELYKNLSHAETAVSQLHTELSALQENLGGNRSYWWGYVWVTKPYYSRKTRWSTIKTTIEKVCGHTVAEIKS